MSINTLVIVFILGIFFYSIESLMQGGTSWSNKAENLLLFTHFERVNTNINILAGLCCVVLIH